MKTITELKELIPPLSNSEYALLEESILQEGCRDALVMWGEYLVDGHHRLKICEEHGIEYKTISKDFDDLNAVKIWMIDNQGGRRNLSDGWLWELKQTKKAILLEIGKTRMSEGGQGLSVFDKPYESHNTQKQLAEELGWSTGKVAQADYVWKHAPDEIKEEVKAGEISINKAYEQTKNDSYNNNLIKLKPHVSNNSGENEWYTPLEYIEAAKSTMGSIDMDPASSDIANKIINAKTYYTIETNGLTKSWIGNIWMNPPYSQPLITQFSDKLAEEIFYGNVNQACILVNNATETGWFRTLCSDASAVCFPSGRIKFLDKNGDPKGAPLQGQAIIYIGDNLKAFTDNFSKFGMIFHV